MPTKFYGYAENNADVEALQAYAGIDIILEDMGEHGQYQILRRFLREGDTLMLVHLSALGDSDAAISAEMDYLRARHIRLRILELPITLQDLDTASAAFVYQALQEVLLVYQRRQEDRQALRSERQQAGIRAARQAGRQLGRPAIGYPKGWNGVWEQWQAREISALEASRKLKMSRSTFYRLAKRYRQGERSEV